MSNFRIFKYYVIFIHTQTAVSDLLAVSNCTLKNRNKYYVIFSKIRQISDSFIYDIQDIKQEKLKKIDINDLFQKKNEEKKSYELLWIYEQISTADLVLSYYIFAGWAVLISL